VARHPKSFVLAVLIAAVWLSTSHAVALCVHADQVGLEPAWALCCETASCCEAAAQPVASGHPHAAPGHDGCRDYTVGLGDDWAPSDPRPLTSDLGCAARPPEPTGDPVPAFAWVCVPLQGVPPPDVRPQRARILRC